MAESSIIYRVLGLMSGTSLDGLDMAYVQFWEEGQDWKFKLGPAVSLDYSDEWRTRLNKSVSLSGLELSLLDREYGRWLGKQAKSFLDEHQLAVDFIASHGHTVFHQIDKQLTVQIGHGQELATASGHQVICDFRTKDVVLGGQGAPLVPIGDELLFRTYDFCLNLGGISNVSFRLDGNRVAYDIGLANMLPNYLTRQIGLNYDAGGKMASSGELNQSLFNELNALPYFDLPFPKSTGYEWFEDEVIPIVDNYAQLPMQDRLCTASYHIAYQVARSVKLHAEHPNMTLWVTGGGAKNNFMIQKLREYLGNSIEVIVPGADLIEFKEAIVFALMGVLQKNGEVNCLSSVTGASVDNSGGVVYWS